MSRLLELLESAALEREINVVINVLLSCACAAANFHPTEMHGITIQEGPDGNTDAFPTYWFWHPWACATNISGCPWVGHGNASRIFDSYLV